MAWIESHQSLIKHRKTIRAASLLKCDRYKLIGHLHALWYWGLDNADKDGVLGDVFDEELADAAGWPERKAREFVAALAEVRFLDKTATGYAFHHWPVYTWRYYQAFDKAEEASVSGTFGNHVRWHVDRSIVAPDCPFCIAPDIAPDIRPESLSTLPPSNRSNQSDQTSGSGRGREAKRNAVASEGSPLKLHRR